MRRGGDAALPPGAVAHVLTVDLEDYFQVSAYADVFPPERWDDVPPRVEIGTRRLLDLCRRHRIRATFFVLGWVAERFPGLVRDIRQQGHRIGCHSWGHRLVYDMSPGEFRADLRRAVAAIEQACGVRPTAYRAPSFSITRESLWALPILAEEGFEIDSSIYPVRHDRYGLPAAPLEPWRPAEAGGHLVEIPPPTVRCCGINVPVAGGGYLRLYPLWLTRLALRAMERRHRPGVIYVHPWELDPDQPVVGNGLVRTARHRIGLGRVERRLDMLLSRHRFADLDQVIASIEEKNGIRVLSLSGD